MTTIEKIQKVLEAKYEGVVSIGNGLFTVLQGGFIGIYSVEKKDTVANAGALRTFKYLNDDIILTERSSLSGGDFDNGLFSISAGGYILEPNCRQEIKKATDDLYLVNNKSVHQAGLYSVSQKAFVIPAEYTSLVRLSDDCYFATTKECVADKGWEKKSWEVTIGKDGLLTREAVNYI